ncbi:hypothetical protein [Candidatus Binatus sp.]|jgi:hypothetical protein|uniref:hypothetical protein n=1 Tax=Candidatus Binatus sp. TaxID=2811406 RepID=UPI003C84640D
MTNRNLSTVVATATLAFTIFISSPATRADDDSEVGSSPDAAITLSNFQAAAVVIGQPDFSSSMVNQGIAEGSAAADTICNGYGAAAVGPTGPALS